MKPKYDVLTSFVQRSKSVEENTGKTVKVANKSKKAIAFLYFKQYQLKSEKNDRIDMHPFQ